MVKVLSEQNTLGIPQDRVDDRERGVTIIAQNKANGQPYNLTIEDRNRDGVTRTLNINDQGKMTFTDANGTVNITGDGKKIMAQWAAAKRDGDVSPTEIASFVSAIDKAKGGHDQGVAAHRAAGDRILAQPTMTPAQKAAYNAIDRKVFAQLGGGMECSAPGGAPSCGGIQNTSYRGK